MSADAQYVGRNINMVSGTDYGTGDPYLQRQNEGSLTASTRNALHLFGGANDYRTVDIPGKPDWDETGDAWLGVFKSFDGGLTWRSMLIPGYPQDTSPEGLASPLRQGTPLPAAADPMVRSGLQGMIYYSGIALVRTTPIVSAVFVARYNDYNDREAADPIRYIGTSMVADGRPSGKFFDKPALATDIPRLGATVCSVGGQSILAGNVYVVYTDIASNSTGQVASARLYLSRSTDCAATWSAPVLISGTNTINQGAAAVVDTRTGTLYVVWRRFATGSETNAVLVTKSTNGGRTFSPPVVISNIVPFEQGTTPVSFRTSGYPTAVTDADGRLYVAWSERNGPSGTYPGTQLPDGRIMLANSPDGVTWTAPVMVAPTGSVRGHQFMPALSYQSGKVIIVHYDLREDSTIGIYTYTPPVFVETRQPAGELATTPATPDDVFNDYVQDRAIDASFTFARRHTLDVRMSQASPGPMPVFGSSQRVSSYRFGYTNHDKSTIRQLEFNPPNLPLFKNGTAPFFGDYLEVAPQYPFIGSILNLPLPAPVFHAVWTDNRDVRPPLDGNWQNYTPPLSAAYQPGTTSSADGSIRPPCVAGQTGMRNQNIYTSRITAGLFFGSPGNDKPLGKIERAYVVSVQNSKTTAQSYRLQIVNQPFGGAASFRQIPLTPPVTTLDITVNPKSTAARPVFVQSPVKNSPVGVVVTEIPAVGGTPAPGALTSATVLNPDPSSPDVATPDVATTDIATAELYTPDVATPDVATPDVATPDVATPDVATPDVATPDVATPDVATPDVATPTFANPDVATPDVATADLASNSVTDTTWPVTNAGNTTASYTTKLLQTGAIPPGIKLQLILTQPYKTPFAQGCTLTTETNHILLNNVSNPTILTSTAGIGNPDVATPSASTVWIAPGHAIDLTVRVIDPFHANRHIPATAFVTPVVVAHAVNTTDLAAGITQPPIALTIITSVPDGIVGTAYNLPFQAIGGTPPYTWSQVFCDGCGGLPPNLTFANGTLTGIAAQIGTYNFTIQVNDSAAHTSRRSYTLQITNPLGVTTSTLPVAILNQPYGTTLTSTGGAAPIHWTLTSGALPNGLSMTDDGTISGTPAAAGAFNFTVQALDSSLPAQTATANLQLNVSTVSISAITPSTAAAGFGQLVAIDVAGLDSLTGVSANFTDTANVREAGFIFGSPSTPQRLYVRLPFAGDGTSTANLQPGPLTVTLTRGTGAIASASMTLSATPGAPTIQRVMGLSVPPLPENKGCGTLTSTAGVSAISPGEGIALSGLGIDTTGATLQFQQAGRDNQVATTTCAVSGTDIGVAAVFTVPNLALGTVNVSMSVVVNGSASAWSAPVTLNVVAPTYACIGGASSIFNSWTTGLTGQPGVAPTFSTNGQTYCLDSIADYHWNNSVGITATSIGLTSVCTTNCQVIGPFPAVNAGGATNNVPANWVMTPPNQVIINGTYTVVDTDSATWSYDTRIVPLSQTAFSNVMVKQAVVTSPPPPVP